MLSQIKQIFRELRCYHIANELETYIETAKIDDLSYLDFLGELLKQEMNQRRKNRVKKYEKLAGFPTIKTLDEFDFRFQTSISKKTVSEWMTFTWIDKRQNKILMGPPGVGKTHLVLSTGFSAVHKGYKVIFFTMQNLLEDMIIAEKEGIFNDFIKKILKYDLIIIDELGYLPLKPIYANLFFQLITHCYEYRSIMITSNKIFGEWGSFFGDQTITTAILDRLVHHAEAIMMNGDSYRLKHLGNEIL
jgi:DNA replication protein DnaC